MKRVYLRTERSVLRRKPELTSDEVTEGWRKLRDKELHNLYLSPRIVRMINENERGGTCSTNAGCEERIYVIGGRAKRERDH
jgi:hypothetical protein